MEAIAARDAVFTVLALREAIQESEDPYVAHPDIVALAVVELGPYLETNRRILLQRETPSGKRITKAEVP